MHDGLKVFSFPGKGRLKHSKHGCRKHLNSPLWSKKVFFRNKKKAVGFLTFNFFVCCLAVAESKSTNSKKLRHHRLNLRHLAEVKGQVYRFCRGVMSDTQISNLFLVWTRRTRYRIFRMKNLILQCFLVWLSKWGFHMELRIWVKI